MKITRLYPVFVCAGLLLSACGGGGGSSTTPTPTIPTPAPTNTAPNIASANSDQTGQAGSAFSYDAAQSGSTFTDTDGDTLSYTLSLSPDITGLTINGNTISGTPSQSGTTTVTITASDGNGGQISDSFEINISAEVVTSGKPNIIFILSDDQGKDSSAEYNLSSDLPNTPNLTTLANNGVIFENTWVAPTCSPTRAALLTGKHAGRTNVMTC